MLFLSYHSSCLVNCHVFTIIKKIKNERYKDKY
jgi:hypothetical protein